MRSTTFYLLFEGMLNVGAGSFNVYMLSMLNALLNVGVYVLLFTCKTRIGVGHWVGWLQQIATVRKW